MKNNYCIACGLLQQYTGEKDFICERCGAHNNGSSCSYDLKK